MTYTFPAFIDWLTIALALIKGIAAVPPHVAQMAIRPDLISADIAAQLRTKGIDVR
jgi:hypothetical protein